MDPKNKHKTNIIKNKVFSGLIWTFLERTTSQSVTLILSIVLARLLSPHDYGVIAIVMVFISLADVFITSGFGNSLIQKKDADNVDFSSVFYFSIVFSWVIYFILFFTAPYIESYFKIKDLKIVIRVLGLYLPISGFITVQQAFVSKRMMFKKFFISTLTGTIISAFIGIIFALNGGGVWALVAQRLSNATINSLVLWKIVNWRPSLEFSLDRLKVIFSYGWKLLVSSLIASLSENVTNLIIGKKFSSQDLAFYTQGSTYPRQIGTNINNTISKVIFPALSEHQDDLFQLKFMMRRSIKTGTYIMTPMLIGLAIIAEPLVKLLLSDKWIEAVPFIQIFSVYYIFVPIHTINLQAIKAIGRSDLFLKLEIIKRLYGLLILIATVVLFDSVIIIALGLILQTLISCFINSFPNKKLLNYGYIEQFLDIIPNITSSVLMGIIVHSLTYLNLNNISQLILQIFVGVITYISLSYFFKLESFKYLSNTILSWLKIPV